MMIAGDALVKLEIVINRSLTTLSHSKIYNGRE
jgi:hypothetical protein